MNSSSQWRRGFPTALVAAPVAAALSFAAQAQAAHAQETSRVAAAQRVTEKKSGAGAWQRAGAGTVLAVGDSFRTGKRSKADIKFTDGSLLRLGQLSSVEMRSAKSVRLVGGQLLFAALRPGRVLAGTAAAEIKGSVAIVTANADGSAYFGLYTGAMDIVTPARTIPCPPGLGYTVRPDGTLSDARAVPPLDVSAASYAQAGETSGESLADAPRAGPFTGSRADVRGRSTSERLALDQYGFLADTRSPAAFGLPLPSPPGFSADSGGGGRSALLALAGAGLAYAMGGRSSAGSDQGRAHLEESGRSRGQSTSGDAIVVGLLADGGAQAVGGRLHLSHTRNRLSLDVAAQPLRVWPAGANRDTVDFSAVSDASLLYHGARGTLQIGRQRFLSGPAQVTNYGSMLRPGHRTVMDAISFRPRLAPGRSLEVAYLHDAFARNLPFRIGGAQKGFYGRFSVEERAGNFGFNMLRYGDAPGSDATGLTFDFAVPVVRDKIELYGELGRDPFRRRLTTLGIALPGLRDRADLDVALEYSNLGGRGARQREPVELALRAYRRMGRSASVLASLSRFYGRDTRLLVGLTFGVRSSTNREL